MPTQGLEVRLATGRYPAGKAVFRSDNIEASVVSLGGPLYQVRLDDADHPEFFLDLVVELRPDTQIEEGNPC